MGAGANAAALALLPALPTDAAAGPASASTEAAVRAALNDSAEGWSAGDLDRFMRVYEDSSDTVFLSSTGPIHGQARIRSMYAERFGQAEAGSLGVLGFELTSLQALGASYALVLGTYRVMWPDPAKPPARGVFSLVFHRSAAGWRIVADHSS